MFKKLLGKLGFIFSVGVYIHRFFDGCNDLRYEFYNASAGQITYFEFIKQIVPTLKYHLSGEFQRRIAEFYKEEHIGLDENN